MLSNVLILLLFYSFLLPFFSANASAQKPSSKCVWEICSIDTMKTSRDKARAELNNPSYDDDINDQILAIKNTGANYVAIDTPYDKEFIPYLKRWVNIARKENLSVWFRGNWSSWEGWFDYPKNLTPSEHINKTYNFIVDNPELFKDGDIFDACPECENAGFWPQPSKDNDYNKFIRDQNKSLKNAFGKIGKDVKSDVASIIGGRAKEVLDQNTFDSLNNTVSIDHYFSDPKNIKEYINFFNDKYKTKVLLSELGVPIPDINGPMTQAQQAHHIDSVLNNMYLEDGRVIGVNYWVLSGGTTSLINLDGSERQAYSVLKKYFNPGHVSGRITNPLGDVISGITVQTGEGIKTQTDKSGNYFLKIPPRTGTIAAFNDKYEKRETGFVIVEPGQAVKKDFVLDPINPDMLYKARSFITKIFH